jgi:NADH dehydrogenase [ubiquinone] 1 alpha subcomplex assembly factor 7
MNIKPADTAMAAVLRELIENEGPITMARYMAECLGHEKHGYYMTRDPFGVTGDFITAPEISQMFGEIIGLWLASQWQTMGAPERINLIEMGPGRGTLMADIMRAGARVPGFDEATQVHFVETSQLLMAAQREKFPDAHWHLDLSDLPAGPSLFIANEFFDALPVHQFEKAEDDGQSECQSGWMERVVSEVDGGFQRALAAPSPASALIPDDIRANAKTGDCFEISPASISVIKAMIAHLKTYGGAGIIFDYGYFETRVGDSIQALFGHQYDDIFAHPGDADLTAHVNFEILAGVAREQGLQVIGPFEQGEFLLGLGIGERATRLAIGKAEETQLDIIAALKRLTAPDQMGQLYKVVMISTAGKD